VFFDEFHDFSRNGLSLTGTMDSMAGTAFPEVSDHKPGTNTSSIYLRILIS
jgi:hypothetical protein